MEAGVVKENVREPHFTKRGMPKRGKNPHYVGNVETQEEKDALIAKYGNQALRPSVKPPARR